jgi:hypothetical protein
MPRLPGALAVLLTMGVCIGFNTIRYPVVWQMVSEANRWPASPASGAAEGSGSAAAPAGNSQATPCSRTCEAIHVEPGLSGPIPTTAAAPPPKTRVVCNGSMCCLVKEEPAPQPAAPQPAPAVAKPGSAARDAAPVAAVASGTLEAMVAAPLVPIVRPPKPPVGATVLSSSFEATEIDPDRLAQDKVRRLPPTDRIFPAPSASPQEPLPADQVPFYPSTGARPAG